MAARRTTPTTAPPRPRRLPSVASSAGDLRDDDTSRRWRHGATPGVQILERSSAPTRFRERSIFDFERA
jgi:hypothetical protein